MTRISEYLDARYRGRQGRAVAERDFIERACRRHIKLGLADQGFEEGLCSGSEARYWQRLSEVLFGHELLEAGLDVKPFRRHGPDFLIEHQGGKTWIEVTCPEPEGIPADWLEHKPSQVSWLPHEKILLRWTSAIKEKAQQLLGSPDRGRTGYLGEGIVGPNDAYVIAINGRLLRGSFASIDGITQFPFAVEAVFPIGPWAIQIDRTSGEAVESGHQYRPFILKPNGARVPADTFLDPAFKRVSAVIAADLDETSVHGRLNPIVLIHNPNAANPVPPKLLPARREYTLTKRGSDEYIVEVQGGCLPDA
jgi:hypothetical protein